MQHPYYITHKIQQDLLPERNYESLEDFSQHLQEIQHSLSLLGQGVSQLVDEEKLSQIPPKFLESQALTDGLTLKISSPRSKGISKKNTLFSGLPLANQC